MNFQQRLRRNLWLTLCLVLSPLLLLAAILIITNASRVDASSHREAPLISKDPSVDVTDVYAFVSPDLPDTVTLISNWIPFEDAAGGPNFYHFDDNAHYYIHVDQNGDGLEDISFRWTFETRIQKVDTFLYNGLGGENIVISQIDDPDFTYRQYYTVTKILDRPGAATVDFEIGNLLMPPDNVGRRSFSPSYAGAIDNDANFVKTLPQGIKEFTGQRDDPFFVDIAAIFDLGGLRPFNSLHAIELPNAPGIDDVGGFNIHTTALQIPIAELVPAACTDDMNVNNKACVIGVWSTAERCKETVRGAITPDEIGTERCSDPGSYVQVSRLGQPLVNEAVIPLALKDAFNAIPPAVDAPLFEQAIPGFEAAGALLQTSILTPELATLMPILYPDAITQVPATPRMDIFTIFLNGVDVPDVLVTQQMSSTVTPSEQLRLNVAIKPAEAPCEGDPLGLFNGLDSNGDLTAFPNGRRLEDDVTDMALRAVAGGYGETLSTVTGGFLTNFSPNNLLGDGVDANDVPCLSEFPYLGTPHGAYDDVHPALRETFIPSLFKNE